jgi:hypothetical protein
MAELDPKALYHRTLEKMFSWLPSDPKLRQEDIDDGIEFFKKKGFRTGTAYTIRDRTLVPIIYVEKRDQEFGVYATRWEARHSTVPFGSGSGHAEPVVDENMTIVGHVGWYGAQHIYVPAKEANATRKKRITVREQGRSLLSILTDPDPMKASQEDIKARTPKTIEVDATRGLGELLSDGVIVNVDYAGDGYLKQGFIRPLPPQRRFRIVTCPEGRAQFVAEIDDREAVEASWISPLDLITITKLVMLVGVVAVDAIAIRVLIRPILVRTLRGAATEAAADTAREVASGATREGAGPASRGTARQTLRGIGAYAARTAYKRRAGAITVDEMEAYLKEVLAARPDLRALISARMLTGQGRMDAIQIALKEFENALPGWKVVEKSAAEMQAAGITRDNIVSIRAQLRQLWINNERAARYDPDKFYEQVVHDLSAHALCGRGGDLDGTVLPFIGDYFTRYNNGLAILEHAIKTGNLADIIKDVLKSYRTPLD